MNPLVPVDLHVVVDGLTLQVAGLRRDGDGLPVVFLHGFGSTKEDYADVVHVAELDGRPVLAYDAPGCGATDVADPAVVDVAFLVATAEAVLDAAGVERCQLVGHSMGGLTALLLADRDPQRIVGFADIEGNLAPEDCFLSRQVIEHPANDPKAFLSAFARRLYDSRYRSSALYAAGLAAKVDPEVVAPIFRSMVELSDHGGLLERFLALPCPTMLVYGEQNSGLTYLDDLARHGVELAEIPQSGHFPMYSNAVAFWARLARFLEAHSSP